MTVDRRVTDEDVRLLRWSLLGFGLLGFITPLVLAFWTSHLTIDIFALVIGIAGATLNRQSFAKFPWEAWLCLLYPLVFVTDCFSPEVSDYRYWLIPTRGTDAPLVLHLTLAAWACVNVWFIYRFHRMQKAKRTKATPWQYSLRFLFGLTALMAVVLSLHTWYYQFSQPPHWASTDALQRRYATQLSELAEHAYHFDATRKLAPSGRDKIEQLFQAEEIVGASVWTRTSGGCHMPLAIKSRNTPTGTCRWLRTARIGRPIVNLWDQRFVEYQALLKDKKGVERGYSLVIDLSKMSEGTRQ